MTIMKTMKAAVLMASAVLLAAPALLASAGEAAATGPAVLHDGDKAKIMRFDNMHQVRFIELFFAVRDPKTGKLVAPCFNTMYSTKAMPASKGVLLGATPHTQTA